LHLGSGIGDLGQKLLGDRFAARFAEILGRRIVAAGQNVFGIRQRHFFNAIEQNRFGFDHRRFGRAVHGRHQLIRRRTHADLAQQFLGFDEMRRQGNLHPLIAQKTIGSRQFVDRDLGATRERFAQTLARLLVGDRRKVKRACIDRQHQPQNRPNPHHHYLFIKSGPYNRGDSSRIQT